MDNNLKRTPLYETHLAASARMVPFAGWEMPVLYTGILEEARAVRTNVGIFDISHMGVTRIYGSGATALLQKVTSNNVDVLSPSEAQYSLLTNPQGGVIDDIIVYREGAEAYLIVLNASNTEKDLAWIRSHTPAGVSVDDHSDETVLLAVQGPNAPKLVADLFESPALLETKRFQYATVEADWLEGAVFCCRTGYTGEDGFELIVRGADAIGVEIWRRLCAAGAVPCGLGARDALRIEAGYPLYGHEIDDTTSPVEAGLMWVVKPEKGTFIGAEAIQAVKTAGPKRRLVGLISAERSVPRQGYPLYAGENAIGEVTSGVFSPTHNRSVAMGYVEAKYSKPGTQVEIAIRDKRAVATVVPKKSLLEG